LQHRLAQHHALAVHQQAVLQDSQLNRVAKAIRILRDNYAQPLRVEEIARNVHMSVSSLHHHFKQATAMSPLQYQKHLR
ncbi:helix-turn-helix transcriptional regulator, partial [Xylella fastidiosa subsp. multiplex]|uniref:AraC family transcriptional regulator n=1 Tax=Xylella fastidiosa TaxID=2371 RepID=UPI0012AE198D